MVALKPINAAQHRGVRAPGAQIKLEKSDREAHGEKIPGMDAQQRNSQEADNRQDGILIGGSGRASEQDTRYQIG